MIHNGTNTTNTAESRPPTPMVEPYQSVGTAPLGPHPSREDFPF